LGVGVFLINVPFLSGTVNQPGFSLVVGERVFVLIPPMLPTLTPNPSSLKDDDPEYRSFNLLFVSGRVNIV
jgi:hypothetical protein